MNNKLITTQATIQGKYPRSRWPFNFNHKTSFNAGELVPLSITEILPGDTINMNVHSLVRMATPIAPIMDNIKQDIWFFFVPRRLVENNWENFITYSDWDSLNSPDSASTIQVYGSVPEVGPFAVQPSSLGNYLGLPLGIYSLDSDDSKLKVRDILAAPFKAYGMIWNYYFRDENYQDEVNDSEIAFYPGSNPSLNPFGPCLKVNEFHDVYTSVLPSPQKGPEVLLPLGDVAPLITAEQLNGFDRPLAFGTNNGEPLAQGSKFMVAGAGQVITESGTYTGSNGDYITATNLVADLSQAVSASINDLRSSILVQHFMEQLARTGSRLQEYYLGFWGVRSPDARLQMPEYIAGTRFNINVSEVLQTTGYNESNNTTLGTTGAVSRTGNSTRSLFTKSFVEHGYLIALTAVRHDLSYSQGIPKMFLKTKAFDYYVPTFNGLGEVEVKKSEILAPVGFSGQFMKDEFAHAGEHISMDDILGYNEPWYEYRFRPSRVSGIMNPVAKEGLDYWTLTKAFTASDIDANTIRIAGRETLDRALSTASSTDQFIIDYFEEADITRVMPTRSIPGLSKL